MKSPTSASFFLWNLNAKYSVTTRCKVRSGVTEPLARFCCTWRKLHRPQQTVSLITSSLPQAQRFSLGATQHTTYLYGMCLLPLTRARMTLPSADNERQRPELPSRFLLSTFTQLPRSIRCKRLRPPDTAMDKESKQLVCASKSSFPGKQKTHHNFQRGNNPETFLNSQTAVC